MFVFGLTRRGNSVTDNLETVMRGVQVAVLGAALATSACGSPAQHSGVVADVVVAGGPGIAPGTPRITVTVGFQAVGQPLMTRLLLADATGVTERVQLQPGTYLVTETVGHGLAPCSARAVDVTSGAFQPVSLRCDIR